MIFTFALVVLAAGTIHRIWIYEQIAKPIREPLIAMLTRYQFSFLVTMLTCPPCFAFWSCVLAFVVWSFSPTAVLMLAMYASLRLALGGFALATQVVEYLRPVVATPPPLHLPIPQTPVQTPAPCTTCGKAPQTPAPAPCTTCGSRKRKVVIFTVFNSLARSYSLVGVALDQARAIALQGHPVEFWTTNGSDTSEWPADMPSGVVHLQIVPHVAWKDDVVDENTAAKLRDFIQIQVGRLGNATIITHDLQFITSYVSFAQAMRLVGPTPGVRWLHMAHSRTSTRPTHPEGVLRSSLVDGHQMLYPSPSDRNMVADYYGISPERVWIAPNIRDIASQNRWSALARVIADVSQLRDADIVQVYPFSTPRAQAKGVDSVIKIFGKLKSMGNTVRLVLVNAHNQGEVPQKEVTRLKEIATSVGLEVGDVIYTSVFPGAHDGASGDVIADLQQVANVFIFPSTSESCGMVMLEAAVNGQLLVLNESLPTMFDAVDRTGAIYVPFGQEDDVILTQVAERVDDHLRHSMENQSKRSILRQYSLKAGGDALVAAIEGVWR